MTRTASLPPAQALLSLPLERRVYRTLDALGIDYQLRRHSPGYIDGDDVPVGREIGATHCKNLFLSNRAQNRFHLLVLVKGKRFVTAELSKQLGVSRLYFGPEDRLPRLLGAQSGYVGALGLVCDADRQIALALDKGLLDFPRVCFHPCTPSATVTLDTRALLEVYLPALGYTPQFVTAQRE